MASLVVSGGRLVGDSKAPGARPCAPVTQEAGRAQLRAEIRDEKLKQKKVKKVSDTHNTDT